MTQESVVGFNKKPGKRKMPLAAAEHGAQADSDTLEIAPEARGAEKKLVNACTDKDTTIGQFVSTCIAVHELITAEVGGCGFRT